MTLLKNKLVLLSPIIAFAVIFLFALTLFPSVQPEPKNLPIAIVNEDEGVELPNQSTMNMGDTMVEMILTNTPSSSDEEPLVKWVSVPSLEEVQKGMDDQAYYAALVIPSDFSKMQASLRTHSPSAAELHIYINQGMNTAAATIASQVLNGVVDNVSNNVRTQLLTQFEQQGAMLSVKQAEALATPITKVVTNVHEVGPNSANGNAPVSMFQPLWMASLASAALIFIVSTKMGSTNRKETFLMKLAQISIGVVISFVIGFGLTWLADAMVGFHIPQFLDTALFLTIAAFSFYVMILAVLSLIGFKGMPIFVLLLFFGAPLLAMAPEMLSPFYRDWIHSWLPMRFMVDGLRELFFFGKPLSWNSSLSTLVWIGIGSIVVIVSTRVKKSEVIHEKIEG